MSINPPQLSSPGWTARTKRMVTLITLALIFLAVVQVSDILPIVVIAVVLSYLLNPLVTFIDERLLTFGPFENHSARWIGILVAFILVFALIVVVIVLVVPLVFDQLQEFGRRIPVLFGTIQEEIERLLSQPITIGNQVFVPLESIEEALGATPTGEVNAIGRLNVPETATGLIQSLTGTAFDFLGGAFEAVINFVFLLTMMFYLLKDGGDFVENLVEITPYTYKGDVQRLLYELAKVWDAYLRGQLILSITMGSVVFTAALIVGLPNAPILGLLSGLFEFIPNIGPALALIPAALLALSSQSATLPFLEGASFALVVIVVWTILQQIEAVVLVPRVMGTSLNLHPFVVIIGVIAGASLAGALGVILAAPVLASLRVLGQYIYGKLTDQNPFVTVRRIDPEEAKKRSIAYRLEVFWQYLRAWIRRLMMKRGGNEPIE